MNIVEFLSPILIMINHLVRTSSLIEPIMSAKESTALSLLEDAAPGRELVEPDGVRREGREGREGGGGVG